MDINALAKDSVSLQHRKAQRSFNQTASRLGSFVALLNARVMQTWTSCMNTAEYVRRFHILPQRILKWSLSPFMLQLLVMVECRSCGVDA